MGFFKKLRTVREFGLINAAEASVLSFLIVSIIGAGALWATEHGRTVHVKEPVLQKTELRVVEPNTTNTSIDKTIRKETHVYTADITKTGESFIDMWFTSVSALCVTGLTSTDFAKFTLPGQVIVLILIQMGGLGIIVFTSIFALLVARGISEREVFKDLLSGILDTRDHAVERMIRHIVKYTIIFEGIGALVMGFYLSSFEQPELLNGINPWWWAIFHSVSAFNNAGFALLNNNLVNFVADPIINYTIASLIILGGIGYPVIIAIHAGMRKWWNKEDEKQKKLEVDVKGVVASPVQTRIAIMGTIILLFVGTAIPLFVDWNNPALGEFSGVEKLTAAFFQSVSTRTAGFNTVDIGSLHVATLFLFMLLMYIGANPAGTAGGIKIPTLAVLYGYIKDWFQKPGQPVQLFHRNVSKFALSHAIRLFFFSSIFISTVIFLICLNEAKYIITPDPTFNFLKVAFEVVSAFGTVGLSMGFAGGVTSFSAILSPFSKFLLIVTMLFGRLGPLTILASLPWKRRYLGHAPSPDFEDAEKIQIG